MSIKPITLLWRLTEQLSSGSPTLSRPGRLPVNFAERPAQWSVKRFWGGGRGSGRETTLWPRRGINNKHGRRHCTQPQTWTNRNTEAQTPAQRQDEAQDRTRPLETMFALGLLYYMAAAWPRRAINWTPHPDFGRALLCLLPGLQLIKFHTHKPVKGPKAQRQANAKWEAGKER